MKIVVVAAAALSFVVSRSTVVFAAVGHPSYMAVLDEIVGTDSNVGGIVAVFSDNSTKVGLAAMLKGLEPNLQNCGNGGVDDGACAVRIHSGTDCYDTPSQGEHYFTGSVTTDPWTAVRYTTSDSNGTAYASAVVDIGTDDLKGRTVVVRTSNGTRVACGLLLRVPNTMTTMTEALVDPIVESKVTVFQKDDTACFYGHATNLERNIQSFLAGGDDCFARNGCGTHIHAGTDCTNETTHMGHHFNAGVVGTDPWERVGYLTTDRYGSGSFTACVTTGARTIQGKVFLIHASDGTRISCGILELSDSTSTTDAPVMAPTTTTSVPTATNTNTTTMTPTAAPDTNFTLEPTPPTIQSNGTATPTMSAAPTASLAPATFPVVPTVQPPSSPVPPSIVFPPTSPMAPSVVVAPTSPNAPSAPSTNTTVSSAVDWMAGPSSSATTMLVAAVMVVILHS